VHDLNATQGSLLGFLYDDPHSGWELLRQVEGGLSRFWNVTPSHVYRELRALEDRKLVKAGVPGVRERRRFTITPAGKKAFKAWISTEPGPEQIRFPLLVTLWFGRHLAPETLAGFLDASRHEHDQRLRFYQSISAPEPEIGAVIAFGIAYESAVLEWLDGLRAAGPSHPD
jgi:DNA-binding PadR family transcriptional regulator